MAPTTLPFNIKSATVGEGQTPVTLSCVEDDGLGEELRVLLAHSMRGHHTANARRHDPPGPRRVTRGQVVVCWSDESVGSMTVVSSRAPGVISMRRGLALAATGRVTVSTPL